jgi:endonuclease I
MHRPFLFFLLLFIELSLLADHLELRRNAGVKSGPESQASVIYQGSNGELFSLLDNGQQTNGYYHVAIPGGSSGWIYRSIVRLHRGDLPNQEGIKTKAIDIFGIGQIPVGYYSTASGLVGEELKNKLHLIVRNHDVITYDEAWEALTETDKDPGNPENVVLLYTMRSQKAIHRDRGTTFDYGAHGYTLIDSWNREHVWPKSHGFPNPTDTAYTDLHHLRPADRSVNSARNTRSFDDSFEIYFDNGGTVETECYTSGTTWTWEPPDHVKGDVARMVFYMAIRYDSSEYDLELVETIVGKGNKEPILGMLPTLLKWHKEDPVDNWERQRNHTIYHKYQGNRNPFIDHPEWVHYIWK